MTFSQLTQGERFTFASETQPRWRGLRMIVGECVKVASDRYRVVQTGEVFTVGTVGAKVVRVSV